MNSQDIYNYIMEHPNYTFAEKMDFSMMFIDAQVHFNWQAIQNLKSKREKLQMENGEQQA